MTTKHQTTIETKAGSSVIIRRLGTAGVSINIVVAKTDDDDERFCAWRRNWMGERTRTTFSREDIADKFYADCVESAKRSLT